MTPGVILNKEGERRNVQFSQLYLTTRTTPKNCLREPRIERLFARSKGTQWLYGSLRMSAKMTVQECQIAKDG